MQEQHRQQNERKPGWMTVPTVFKEEQVQERLDSPGFLLTSWLQMCFQEEDEEEVKTVFALYALAMETHSVQEKRVIRCLFFLQLITISRKLHSRLRLTVFQSNYPTINSRPEKNTFELHKRSCPFRERLFIRLEWKRDEERERETFLPLSWFLLRRRRRISSLFFLSDEDEENLNVIPFVDLFVGSLGSHSQTGGKTHLRLLLMMMPHLVLTFVSFSFIKIYWYKQSHRSRKRTEKLLMMRIWKNRRRRIMIMNNSKRKEIQESFMKRRITRRIIGKSNSMEVTQGLGQQRLWFCRRLLSFRFLLLLLFPFFPLPKNLLTELHHPRTTWTRSKAGQV